MPTSHTLTGDLSDVVGTGFPRDSVWVTITTNLGDNPVFDSAGEQIRFPRHRFALPSNAQFSKSLWSTAALTNPTGYQYGIEVEWPDGAGGTGKKRWFSGWFSLTADKDMSELDYGPMIPPEYYPELLAARDEAVTAKDDAETAQAAAEAAQAAAEAVGDTNDAIMTAVANDSGSDFSAALTASTATVAVGRSAKDFGIGPTRTEAQNLAGFSDAQDWINEAKANESRALVIPPMNTGEYINVDTTTRLLAGFRMFGSGSDSRIRTVTKPEPAFIATGKVHVEGVMFQGLDDRAIPNGAFGTHRENWDAINYSGLLLLSGSDESVVRNVYGKNLGCTVAAWGWDEDAEVYAGNIQGLDVQGVYSRDVWCGLFWREVDFMHAFDIFTRDYAPPGDIMTGDFAAPPHALYCTSSSSIVEQRPMYGNVIGNVRAVGGRYGSAVSIKHLVGAQIANVAAHDCGGLIDMNTLTDCTLTGLSGTADAATVAGVDTLSGSVNIRTSANTRVSDVTVRQAAEATSRLLYMDDDNAADVIVERFRGRSVYATTAVQELALVRGGELRDADIKHTGAGTIGRGIRTDMGSSRVIRPRVSGVTRPVLVDSGAAMNIDYDPADLASTNASGYPKVYASAGSIMTLNSPKPGPRLRGWSDIARDLGLDDETPTKTASGHTWERPVGAVVMNPSASAPLTRMFKAANSSGVEALVADFGTTRAEIEMNMRANDATTVVGIVLNWVNSSNYVTVELRNNGVYLCTVVAGSKTDVASYALTRTDQRLYTIRVQKFAGSVTVWVDGTERISAASIGSPAETAVGASTKHGRFFNLSSTGYSGDMTVRALG